MNHDIFLASTIVLDITELKFCFSTLQHEIDYSEELSEDNIKSLLEKFITKRFMWHFYKMILVNFPQLYFKVL